MTIDQHDSYDILIIGGGLVGTALALALAAQPIKIGIVEPQDINAPTQKNHHPALALSKASVDIFYALGLAAKLQAISTPIKTVHVSSAQQFGATVINATDIHLESLGRVMSANALLTILRAETLLKQNIHWLTPARLQQLARYDYGYQVEIICQDTRMRLATNLLVAADGSDSLTRKLLGITAKIRDPQQTAVTAQLTYSCPHQGMAYERFTADGILAALPLQTQKSALVWVLDTAEANALSLQDDPFFLQALQQAWGYRLGRLLQVQHRQAIPLRTVYTRQQVMGPAVLLGNSAHSLHPVAAQGLNLSLRDMAALAEVITEALASGQSLSHPAVLAKYADWRIPEQLRILRLTEGLNSIFSSHLLPLKWLRNAGLLSLGLASPAKNWLAKQAMGISGRSPKLVCGI